MYTVYTTKYKQSIKANCLTIYKQLVHLFCKDLLAVTMATLGKTSSRNLKQLTAYVQVIYVSSNEGYKAKLDTVQ